MNEKEPDEKRNISIPRSILRYIQPASKTLRQSIYSTVHSHLASISFLPWILLIQTEFSINLHYSTEQRDLNPALYIVAFSVTRDKMASYTESFWIANTPLPIYCLCFHVVLSAEPRIWINASAKTSWRLDCPLCFRKFQWKWKNKSQIAFCDMLRVQQFLDLYSDLLPMSLSLPTTSMLIFYFIWPEWKPQYKVL